ncbi:hypothetical protein [Kitasatospora sp. NPDC047058]|uniref:hypothetical protein n=1 Tax=Kitasatospora sp. NPDC047058 TaxID=3155620 RepID=UPI0033D8C37C
MSATIEVHARTVTAVLLADGWHQVHRNSFRIAPYRMKSGDDIYDMLSETLETPVRGYEFQDMHGKTLAGPLTAILATRT